MSTPLHLGLSMDTAPKFAALEDVSKNGRRKPFIIGVCGGTASGKTTVCDLVMKLLGVPWVAMLSQDRFYKSLTPDELALAKRDKYNFDHPSAFEWDYMSAVLDKLANPTEEEYQHGVKVPDYSFELHKRKDELDTFHVADVIIVEGILALYHKDVRAKMDMKIFVETDDDIRLARRVERDMAHRGRTLKGVFEQYFSTVKPAHDEFIAPSKRYADIIIPRGGDNYVAINLLVEHIRTELKKRGYDLNKPVESHVEGLKKHEDDIRTTSDIIKSNP